MNYELDDADLGEMLIIAKMSRDSGFSEVRINVDHAIEILERVLEGAK